MNPGEVVTKMLTAPVFSREIVAFVIGSLILMILNSFYEFSLESLPNWSSLSILMQSLILITIAYAIGAFALFYGWVWRRIMYSKIDFFSLQTFREFKDGWKEFFDFPKVKKMTEEDMRLYPTYIATKKLILNNQGLASEVTQLAMQNHFMNGFVSLITVMCTLSFLRSDSFFSIEFWSIFCLLVISSLLSIQTDKKYKSFQFEIGVFIKDQERKATNGKNSS